MKRFSCLLLCAAILFSFAACGSSDNHTPAETVVSATVPVTEPPHQTEPTAAPTQAPAAPAVMGETVIVDQDSAAFIITKTEHSEHLGMQLHVQCVNRSGRALMFSWDMVSVCGYMYDPLWATEVAAGKTANATVDLDTYALEEMGIHSIDEITFTLRISDSENWMAAPLVEETHTIYPTGMSVDTLVLPTHPESAGQAVITEDENLRFVIEAFEENDSGCTVSVYMENKTGRNLMYSWDLVSVNGMMIDPFWATLTAAGKKACSEIFFSRADLEANGITEISSIEFKLIVSDYDNWDTPNLLEKTFTYTP